AAASGRLAVAELLLAHRVRVDGRCAQNMTPLISAARTNNVAMLAWLLQHDANLELADREGTAIQQASGEEGFRILLDARAKLDDPMCFALQRRWVATAQALLDGKAEATIGALRCAIAAGSMPGVQLLLAHGVTPVQGDLARAWSGADMVAALRHALPL